MRRKILSLMKKVYRYLHSTEKKIQVWRYLNYPYGDKYYIMGTPTHTNIGDSAIALAEKSFIGKCITGSTALKELSFSEIKLYSNLLPATGTPYNHFFGMGGVTWAISGLQRKYYVRSLLLNI